MNNIGNNSEYQVPAFGRRDIFHFVDNQADLSIYQELNQIAEEIEQCRLKNC